ncbi:MAG: nucleoside diphosphate kinase regulator [Gracilimonas sp.]|uniref:nucleoside diphosphate kinase regulator n=1 Tax=Gracilimonas sp. TaxID=1974203 RepID=UPI003752D56F|nr:nucleoside diphosphate kinase regulator [Gracilimonas sp.]
MNRIILSSLDYKRIYDSIGKAQDTGAISNNEAESLAAELEQAKILEPQMMPHDVVTMNSKVKITFVKSGNQIELKIVYPEDADINQNLISIFSPIAAALIGYKVGDTIDWIVPSGPTSIKIDEITYQPEAAGQFDL